MHIGLKAGGDNKEYIRSPRPTARASNRKRKASTTRNTTHDSAQPVRKRARTALQYEHYYHDDPDNDDTHEHLTGALPPSTSDADYARYDVGPSYLSTSQPPSYTRGKPRTSTDVMTDSTLLCRATFVNRRLRAGIPATWEWTGRIQESRRIQPRRGITGRIPGRRTCI